MEVFIAVAGIGGFVIVVILAKSAKRRRIRSKRTTANSRRIPFHDRVATRRDPFVESVDLLLESSEHRPKHQKSFDPTTALPSAQATTIFGAAYVVDGDTIVIQKTQIRLFGVDAPELDHPYGKKVKWALVSMCKGKKIRAEVAERDAHGRTVAKCYLPDGSDLSAEMVKQGMAIDWPKYSGGAYRLISPT